MSGAASEFSGALVTLLRGDAAMLSLLGGPRVYSHVPDDVAKPPRGQAADPYVQFAIDAKPWDTSTEYGKELGLELWAWTEHEGPKQARAIVDRIETLFRSWAPAMASHRLVNIVLTSTAVFRDGEGQTYCGYQRWRAVTEET